MNNLVIKNIGPIKDIEISLRKVNVLMGPQSSGKSTIAKIISYCQWVEKRFILDGNYDYEFEEQFIDFHKVSKNYFQKDSVFIYETDFVKITFNSVKKKEKIERKSTHLDYKKSKNIYIPAERNFVSVIPNLGRFKETNDNIMSFLYDWYDVKKKYSKKNPLQILDFNIKYHHIEDKDIDILSLTDIKKDIPLQTASSGLQSVVPLIILIDYLTGGFYDQKFTNSVSEKDEIQKIIKDNFFEIFDNVGKVKQLQNLLDKDDPTDEFTSAELKKLVRLVISRNRYHRSKIIIEEPEQNLFPATQRNLMYYLLQNLNESDRDHQLLITTHSPYILYALNNCMLGYHIKDSIPKDEAQSLLSFNSWIDQKNVAVWEIEKSGTIKSIKSENTGTVSEHYFNKIMNDVMDEYYEMLSYLEV